MVERAGLENRSRKNVSHEQHDTCDDGPDALALGLRAQWPELAEVVRVWPKLPPVVRAGIVATVRAVTESTP